MPMTPKQVDEAMLQSQAFKQACNHIDAMLLQGRQVMPRSGIPEGMVHLIVSKYEEAGWRVEFGSYSDSICFRLPRGYT